MTNAGGFLILFLENIERIEIIRGPGSALYGANAFTAVINLITTDPQKLDGVQVGAEGSSYEGQRYHLLAGKQFESWSASFFAQYYQNGGQESWMPGATPRQSGGEIQDKHMQAIDLEAQLAFKGFKLDMRYLRRKPHSFYSSLTANPPNDDDLHYLSDTLSFYGSYQHAFLDERLRLHASLEYKYIDMAYQISLIGYPRQIRSSAYSDDMAGELSLSYGLFGGNTLSGGLRLGQERFWDSSSGVNFFPPTDELIDWFEVPLYPEADRQVLGVYLEDVWDIGEKVSMTIGGRVDHYDEFGSSLNPRFALVYTPPVADLALKALYGGAFRAPSLIEKADAEFDLEAEDLQTYELGISYNLPKIVTIQGNYFYTTIENLIDPDERENVGEFLTQGFELEVKGSYKGHYAWVNYSYNNAEDVQTGLSIYGMSPHAVSAGMSLSIFERANFSAWGYLRGERKMERTGHKETLAEYAQLNMTLRVKDLFTEGLEGYVSVYNLFDTDYKYPIREFMAISARGREVLLGVRYTF